MNDNYDENKEEQEKKDREIDNLINIVENHTRTERHLEQYSHIGNPENKENARNKQNVREDEIKNLKHQIIGDEKNTKEDEIKNLKENYRFSQGYIESNKDHMNEEDLRNLEQRQQNRRIQIENLEDNN